MSNASGEAACPQGFRGDDLLFHAASGDCAVPELMFPALLGEIAVLSFALFALLLAIARSERLARQGPVIGLFRISVVRQLSLLTMVLAMYLQKGFYEAGLCAWGICFAVDCIIVRQLVCLALQPVALFDQSGRLAAARLMALQDRYLCLVLIVNCCFIVVLAYFCRDSVFNYLLAAYATLFIALGWCTANMIIVFHSSITLENVLLRSSAYQAKQVREAILRFVDSVKSFRRFLVVFFFVNTVPLVPVSVYIVVAGSFPVNMPLSAALLATIVNGSTLFNFMIVRFMDASWGRSTGTGSASISAPKVNLALMVKASGRLPGNDGGGTYDDDDDDVEVEALGSSSMERDRSPMSKKSSAAAEWTGPMLIPSIKTKKHLASERWYDSE